MENAIIGLLIITHTLTAYALIKVYKAYDELCDLYFQLKKDNMRWREKYNALVYNGEREDRQNGEK